MKKRGRKPKNEYYLNKQVDNVDTDNRPIIICIPISIERINDLKFPGIDTTTDEVLGYFSENNYKKVERTKYTTIGPSSDTPIHVETLNINETKSVLTEIYDISLIKENTCNFSVDICCFWCCHEFDTRPVFIPIKYEHLKEKFRVKGCFCSFNCCLSYMNSNIKYRGKRYLLGHMYKIFTGNKIFDIEPAPPREALKKFGGHLTINEFRDSNDKNVKFQIQEYPISYISTQIKKTSILIKEIPKEVFPRVSIDKDMPIIKNSLSKIISSKPTN